MKEMSKVGLCILMLSALMGCTSTGNVKKNYSAFIKHEKQAEEYWKEGKFELAEAEYAQCTNLVPKLPGGYFNLGLILYVQKKYSQAETAFKIYINKAPKQELGYYYMSMVLFEQNKPEKAMDYAKQYFKLNGYDSRNNFNLAPHILKAGFIGDGLRCIDYGLLGMEDQKDPMSLRQSCAKCIYSKAQIYEKLNRPFFAMQSFYYLLGNLKPTKEIKMALVRRINELRKQREEHGELPLEFKQKENAFEVVDALCKNKITPDMLSDEVSGLSKTVDGKIMTSSLRRESAIHDIMLSTIITSQNLIWGMQPKEMEPYYSITINYLFEKYLKKDSFVVSFSNGSQ